MEATQCTVVMVMKEASCIWSKQEVFHVGDAMES